MSFVCSKEISENWKLLVVDDAKLKGEICTAEAFAQYEEPVVDAQVPGDWVLDYVKAGLMEEPYYEDNYLKVIDYETHHVFYSTVFSWDGGLERTFLRFEGIDTVADIYLNGEMIGHAENMYIPHEFEAKGLVRGENELLVHIKPVCLEARKYPIAPFQRAGRYTYPSLVIRKAAHMYSWDICPRIVTSGLWREVSIVEKPAERIEDVFLWISRLENGKAHCAFSFDVEIGRAHVKNYAVKIEGVCGDSRFEYQDGLWHTHNLAHFAIEDVRLWWPRGYGEQNIYDITVSLLKNGEVVDTKTFRQGMRTAKLINSEVLDANDDGDFCFVINDKRIYIKGTNWVPADAFHSNDEKRIPAILDLVKDIGCNAMRVWGGGVYENDYFYNWCDENGIVIWQDFMMACAIYPQNQRMKEQLEVEARTIVRRLRHHACICLWAGDNECDQFYCWFDIKRDPDGNPLTRGVLPNVLYDEDISRPYLPSSPFVSSAAYKAGQERQTPEQHLWGPRDYFKGHFYHDANALFASEMGYHGCNSPEGIYKFMDKEKSWPVEGNPMYLYHSASPELGGPNTYRIKLMSTQLRFLFEQEPQNLDEYARMSQISQAEAKKFFVECFRARRNKRTGLIWWNIMDCWPQISDAVVDYHFYRKLAYFYIRRSQQDVCLMMDDHTGELVLYGVNDRLDGCCVNYKVRDLDSGEVLIEAKGKLAAEASTALYTIRDDGKRHFYVIEWETCDGVKGSNHYLQGAPKYDFHWYMDCLKKAGFDEFEGF